MTDAVGGDRQGPFWDFLAGRRAPPPAAVHVQFLTPAKPGELRGRGRVVRRGRDIGFLAGELTDSDGRMVATATATAVIRRPRPG